ncbi:alpha-2-macroglobulin family protein [Glacieibacterium frigidum]|nr:MG2 domain-containing protein [Glacieibacterium frigidum]
MRVVIPALLVVAAGLGVRAASAPQAGVELFSPSGSVERVEQIKIRFATPMVAFGDPRLPAPGTGNCTAKAPGRWVDARTFAVDLSAPLPGGLRCTYTLTPGLKDAAGARVVGRTTFAFDTGGPNIRSIIPQEDSGSIEEDSVFLLALNALPTPASVAAHASCTIEGVGEAVPLDLLPNATRDKILSEAGQDYSVRRFLGEAGQRKAEYEGEEIPPRAEIVAAKCRRAFPAGGRVAILWGAGIASPAGLVTAAPRRLDFQVRAAFAARFECSRVNAAAACSPLEAMRVAFTGEVPVELAAKVRLVGPSGSVAADKIEGRKTTIGWVKFSGPFDERAKYRVEMPAGLTDDAGRTLANAARFPLEVATGDLPPLAKFAGPFGIVEAAEGGVLPVTLRGIEAPARGLSTVPLNARTIAVDSDATVARWLRALEEAETDTSYQEPIAGTKDTQTINTTRSTPLIQAGADARALTIPKPGGARAFEVVGIPLKTNGFHVVEIASPILGRALLSKGGTRYVAAGALVTDMAVHFQWGRGRSLAWVTRLKDATVVAGAKIAVSDYCSGQVLWTGTTDRSGRAVIGDLPDPASYGSCRYSQPPLMVSARTVDDYSFTITTWNQGIQPGDFQLPTGYGRDNDTYHSVFDRTLLKAGETVHIKHFIRTRSDRGLGFPAELPKNPSVVIRHTGSDQSYELPLALGRDGVGVSEWAVPKDAAQGDYEVSIAETGATDRKVSGSFKVDEFRLPTIRATVRGPAAKQVAPTAVPIDLSLTYLSGGAVARAPVKLRTLVETRDVEIADYPGFTFAGEPVKAGIVPLGGGEEAESAGPMRASVEPVTLAANGGARVTVGKLTPVTRPSRLVAEMDYDDANGEVATVSANIDLDPSSLRVGIAGDGWLMKADDLRLKLVVLDLDNRPVKGARVKVALFSRETYSYRKRLIGGFYAYDNSRETKQLDADCTGTSDDKGLVSCAIDVGVSGEVIAQATVADSSGRVSTATKSVWLAGDDDWWFGGDNGDRMDVVAEAPEVAADGVARLQVRMPFRSATALVSVLRDGVIDSFVTQLDGKDPVVEVQMKRGYAPDVYVSVLAVRGRVAGWRLWLADLARRWNLPWISRDAASPTALVDLAKPSYRLGMVKLRVGWDDHRLGVKVASDAPTYGVRKVAQVAVQVTAPKGRTLPSAEIAFAAVDEALLQLQDNASWDVLTAMMAERPVWVQTSTAQGQVVGKRHYGRKAVAAGGGGGEGAGGDVRRDFQPLLLWRARVPLDAQGRARVAVPLNDALTGFRLVAVASAGADLFGTGSATIRTTQPLQILPGIPPLVREGDRYVATVLARNATAKPMRITLTGRAGTLTLPARTVDVAANDAVTVGWAVVAPPMSEPLPWSVDAVASANRDRVQVVQTIAPAVPVTVWQASLVQLSPSTQFPVALPVGGLPGRGGIDIALSRTLGGTLPGVRAYMAAYPYDCIEQQLSRAVSLGDRAMWDRTAAALPAYLDPDGLVRFFPASWIAGDDSLTAYILRLSADAGWALPAEARERMIAGLQSFVAGRTVRSHAEVLVIDKGTGDAEVAGFGGDLATRRLAAVAALTAAGSATPTMVEPLALTPDAWPTIGVVDWAYILQRLPGIPDAATKLTQAENVLRARLDLQGTRLTLARADDPWQVLASGDTTAARLLTTVAPLPGWRDDIGALAKALMLRQQKGHWDTTPANAVGTLAMADFSRRFERVPVGGTTRVTVGAAARDFAWGSGDPAPQTLAWPPARAPLAATHTGSGAPWATITARAAVPLTKSFASGFAVRRQVFPVSRALPDRWSRGDVMRVRIEVTSRAPVEWVVIDDPVPGGATILGGSLGGRSQILAGGTAQGLQPTFVERKADAVHAHFAWMPKAPVVYEYTLRLGSQGVFRLPPTKVAALYSPEMMALIPNRIVEVAAAK